MDILIALIIGGIVGWLASILMGTNAQMGVIANVVVGVVGSALGHYLAGALGVGGGRVMQWIIAGVGAMILIGVLKAVGVFR